jgi:DNA ligase 1
MVMILTFFFYVYVFILHQAEKIVKKVYSVLPDYDKIVSALLKDGVWELPMKCDFTPGVPVGPMLSNATKSVSEILNKFLHVSTNMMESVLR